MLTSVVAWYARRIVNVNINIVLAGVLALGPVLVCVRVAEYLLSSGLVKNQLLHTRHHLVISAVTFFSDIIFDVGIYFVLHWLANHAGKRIPMVSEERIEGVAEAAAESVPFFKDAAKVQMQRAVLSPLLYILWLGSQFMFINTFQWSAVWATVVGFCIAIGTVRAIHTFWMLREERKLRARLFVAGLPRCGEGDSPALCDPVPGAAARAVRDNGHAASVKSRAADGSSVGSATDQHG